MRSVSAPQEADPKPATEPAAKIIMLPTASEVAALGSGSVQSSWCNCDDAKRVSRAPFRDRLIQIEDRAGLIEMTRVIEYCVTCRGVLKPIELCARLHQDEAAFEADLEKIRLKARNGIGKPLLSTMLPTWAEVIRFAPPEPVEIHQLYDGWGPYRRQPEVVAARLRRYFGIAKGASRSVMTQIGNVQIDERLVSHPLDPKYPRRFDKGHLGSAPFVVPTLQYPTEIFLAPEEPATADAPGTPEAFHFFRLYALRGEVLLHCVLVHSERKHAFTAYAIDRENERFRKLREGGTLKYSVLEFRNQKSRS